jgi:hypothetical protein
MPDRRVKYRAGWYLLTYEPKPDQLNLVRQVVPLRLLSARIEDLHSRYGRKPDRIEWKDSIHLDVGGSIMVGEPSVDVALGKNRTVSVFKYQAPYFVVFLREATERVLGGSTWVRLSTWPGLMTYLSIRDRNKLLRELGKVD